MLPFQTQFYIKEIDFSVKYFITLLFFLAPAFLFSQSKLDTKISCSYYGEKMPQTIFAFNSDNDAQTALNKIMEASGLPSNFKLVAGNVPNACAAIIYNVLTKSYERYIIYNQTFFEKTNSADQNWIVMSILAHEVGHHLAGHSLKEGGSRPELELEADKFSGFIMQKLNASLEQAQVSINSLTSETTSVTHPEKSARLAAIANGWKESASKSSTNKKSEVNNRVTNVVRIGSKVRYEVESTDCILMIGYLNKSETKISDIMEKPLKTWAFEFEVNKENQKLQIEAWPKQCKNLKDRAKITVKLFVDNILIKEGTSTDYVGIKQG